MISVQYDRDGISVSVEGHAGAAEPGEDLVCACATILFYTLAENVQAMMRRFGGSGGSELERGNGCAWYNAWGDEDANAAREAFDAVCLGFQILAEKYPQNAAYEEI